jgi:hypothetical protein
MAKIHVEKWWKATEIPLVETDWRNIKLYCKDAGDFWNWSNCVYFIRLGPPYQIAYGGDEESNSPLIYIGKGKIGQRWGGHRNWLEALGRWLPGGRYEMLVFQNDLCNEIESDLLTLFPRHYGRLPLANRKGGAGAQKHTYDDNDLETAAGADRRYWWALRPTQPDVQEYYEKGVLPAKQQA